MRRRSGDESIVEQSVTTNSHYNYVQRPPPDGCISRNPSSLKKGPSDKEKQFERPHAAHIIFKIFHIFAR